MIFAGAFLALAVGVSAGLGYRSGLYANGYRDRGAAAARAIGFMLPGLMIGLGVPLLVGLVQ